MSPLYDVNPIPYGDCLSLNVTEVDNSIDVDVLLDFAFLIDKELENAKNDIMHICKIVKNNWMSLAQQNGISRDSILRMEDAFSFAEKIIM